MVRGIFATFLIAGLALFCAPALARTSPETLFEHAEKKVEALKTESPKRLQKRSTFEDPLDDLKKFVRKYPNHEKVPTALFLEGRVYQELYQSSKNKSDLLKAIEAYRKVSNIYPSHGLADDALYQEASIQWKNLGNAEKARTLTKRIMERYAAGDQVKRAVALQATLPPPSAGNAQAALPTPKGKEKRKLPPVRVIAIDPGHGGEDPGARGPHGVEEKDMALQISRRLKVQLEKTLKVEAFLTRDTDVFIPLDQRPKIANDKKADLFISIHCNANPNAKMSGIQTYFLDTIRDDYSRRLAARENAVSLEKISDLEMILLDLANRENHELSARLAGLVHHNLYHGMKKRYRGVEDLGVRTAIFYVLFQAEMPAILVETSFISNPKEEKRLRDPVYQDDLAKSITQGIKAYIQQGDKIVGTL